MIETPFAPDDWFIHYDPLKPGPIIDSELEVLEDAGLKGDAWEQELALVLATCRALGKTATGAYALMRVAEIAARKGYLERARDILEEASGILTNRNDQKAILEWDLGSVEWELRKQTSGYNHWKTAKAIYDELLKESTKEHKQDQEQWYKDCLEKLNHLELGQAFSARGGYLLLNHFGKSRLGPVTSNLAQEIRRELDSKKPAYRSQAEIELIRTKVSMLEKGTCFSGESSEALVECGLMSHDLGKPEDLKNSERCLRLAEGKYNSDPDNLSIVYWILGAVLWNNNGLSQTALESWTNCQKKIQELKEKASNNRDRPKLEWYKMLAEIIEQGVKYRIEQANGSKGSVQI